MASSFIEKIVGELHHKDPVFEPLREDGEDGEIDQQNWSRYQKHSNRRSKLWNASCFILGTLLGIAGLSLVQHKTGTPMHSDKELLAPPTPQIPVVETTFERHDLFSAPPSKDADRAWKSLLPYGDGFINVNNSEALGLPPGIQSPDGNLYDISMFHQLHCLMHIRQTLFISRLALNGTNSKKIDETLIEPSMEHVYHCFDYIRQAVMCAGDLTLEWPKTEKNGQRLAVNGWGVSHQCKSWDAISDYMSQNRKQPGD